MCADLADNFTVADPPSGLAHLVRLEASLKLPVGSKLSHVKSRRVTVQRGELFLVAEFPVGANDPDLPLGASSRAPAPDAERSPTTRSLGARGSLTLGLNWIAPFVADSGLERNAVASRGVSTYTLISDVAFDLVSCRCGDLDPRRFGPFGFTEGGCLRPL